MARFGKFFSAVLVFALCLAIGAGSAAAAPPVRTGEMEVQIWPGIRSGEILLIVGLTLPDKTPLPATVRLPIPSGSEVAWAGEISTSTAGGDVALEPRIAKGKGGSYAEFQLNTYRRAQIELSGLEYRQSGTVVNGTVEFVQSVPGGLTGFAVRVPATASDVKIDPRPAGEPERNEAGEFLFTLPSKEMKAGDKTKIEFSYDTALPSAKLPMDSSSRLIVIFSVLIVLAIVALVTYVVTQRSRPPAGPADE